MAWELKKNLTNLFGLSFNLDECLDNKFSLLTM